jgi:hypothetical protein
MEKNLDMLLNEEILADYLSGKCSVVQAIRLIFAVEDRFGPQCTMEMAHGMFAFYGGALSLVGPNEEGMLSCTETGSVSLVGEGAKLERNLDNSSSKLSKRVHHDKDWLLPSPLAGGSEHFG